MGDLWSEISIQAANVYAYDPLESGIDVPEQRTFVSTDRHTKITADILSERFAIGPKTARATLRATRQSGSRSAILPLARRYKADRRYQLHHLDGKFATDTFYSTQKSLTGNTCTQLFSHKCGFNAPYHMERANGDCVGSALGDFIHEFGIPGNLTFDGALVQTGRKTLFQDNLRKYHIRWHVSQPYRPNENPAEGSIREVKKKYYRLKSKYNVPDRLWDFLVTYVCEIGNVTATSSKYSNGRTPLKLISGNTPEISEYLDFSFYDYVAYKPNAGVGNPEVGRWLGVAHRVGPDMSYWILPCSGIPIACTTVQRITNLEQQQNTWQKRINEFNQRIEQTFNTTSTSVRVDPNIIQQGKLLSLDDEDEEFIQEYSRVIDSEDVKHIDDLRVGEDNYIGMELGIRRHDDARLDHAVVKRRKTDIEGRPMGIANKNPILDTSQYKVEYHNGDIEILTANQIAENLLAQVDEEGNRQMFIDEIIDHRATKDAITKDKATYITKTGRTRKVRTTRGWELYVQWKDGSGDWVSLKDLKDSYPIELAQYAVDNNLQTEAAFAWWVPYVQRKRRLIIGKLKSKYWQRTHKYGIRIPKSIEEAKAIDEENGNTLWMDAIRMEMANVMTAFDEIDDPSKLGKEFNEITGHLIFDVKLGENFRRKARWVADGHKTSAPSAVTYSTVVSRDSVRIIFLVAALNDLDVQGADIQNAYLIAPNKEKLWMKAGPEFGDHAGKYFVVARALYGLKSAGASFRSFLAKKLDEMNFKSCIADPDVWRRPAVKGDGTEYYEYVMTYVDDLIAVSEDAKRVLHEVSKNIKFKNDKIEPPTNYLGAKISNKTIDGTPRWTISSEDYVNAAIKNVEELVKKRPKYSLKKQSTPMSGDYLPELDGTGELSTDDVRLFQELIGVLRWATELGRVDILHEVSILSQYQASPREGHLEQLFNIFGFLKGNPKVVIHMDPTLPNIDYSVFNYNTDGFQEMYRGAVEQLPLDAPKPRGIPVDVTAYVDASHAANKVTRKSHTGYLIFVNRAPIHWYSKRQQTVESSAFSSEFIAMKTCVEAIRGLRYKLRMFGIPIRNDDPAHIFCDNMSVVNNCSLVESLLNKKHTSLAYHATRWSVAAREVVIGWVYTAYNLADALTKRLPRPQRERLFWNWTY